jgi:asparagine synthase (glutamine-hydrolysing)
MCGVAGVFERHGDASPAIVERMLDRLTHRGPDDRGVWAQKRVALGETRLSILDLSPLGHQPMVTPDGKGVLTYNGEVYNYPDLQRELEKEGVVFKSRCDTEVVLHALHRWGPERAVPRFNGMFAFAYHDLRDGSVWLARDRLGIKPLCLARTPSGIVFASEIKALFADDRVLCRPDIQNFITLVIDERLDGDLTPFENVESIVAGTMLRFASDGTERKIVYFDILREIDPQRIIENEKIDFREQAKTFEALLDSSVHKHLVSDAPVAALCSGGLDSGLVTALSKRHRPDVVAYMADIANMEGEELARARRVAEHVGVELRAVPVNEETYFRLWPRAVYAQDQPIYFAQHIAAMAVAERMRADGFKVALSGDGADELFGGYEWQVDTFKLWRRRRLRAEALGRVKALQKLGRFHRWFRPIDLDELARRPFATTSDRVQANLAMRGTVALSARRELRDAALFQKLSPLPLHEDRAFLGRAFADMYLHLGESLRSKDRMFMGFSIESRVPFLETALIDFAMHLPRRVKYDAGRTKWLVHDLAKRRLPKDVVDLRKIGFWVRDSMWRGADEFLKGGALAEVLEWRKDEIAPLVEHLGSYRRLLFRMMCAEMWARMFFRGESPDRVTEDLLRQRSA